MNDKLLDTAAVATVTTAPGWATYLAQINILLTTLSLIAGLAFLFWRWRRAVKTGKTD